jgi:4-hydroxy-tetrahydrodipicolinate reductase
VGITRAGEIYGTHTVGFHSPIDSIELRHEAYSREGFALGAVYAAEWLCTQPRSGLIDFADIV